MNATEGPKTFLHIWQCFHTHRKKTRLCIEGEGCCKPKIYCIILTIYNQVPYQPSGDTSANFQRFPAAPFLRISGTRFIKLQRCLYTCTHPLLPHSHILQEWTLGTGHQDPTIYKKPNSPTELSLMCPEMHQDRIHGTAPLGVSYWPIGGK